MLQMLQDTGLQGRKNRGVKKHSVVRSQSRKQVGGGSSALPKARWALSQEQDKKREAPTAGGGSGATETAAKKEPTDRRGPIVIQRVFLLSEECFPLPGT